MNKEEFFIEASNLKFWPSRLTDFCENKPKLKIKFTPKQDKYNILISLTPIN